MKRRRWSKQDERRLRELYPTHTQKQCAALLARPCGSIKTKIAKLRLAKRSRRIWLPAELRTLRKRFADLPSKQVAKILGRPRHAIEGKARKLGLRKSAAYLASPAACRLRRGDKVGWAHRFRKGVAPWNKGLRRPGWFAGRMRETQFKKGQRSRNWVPVGTVTPNADGYLRIKISDAPEPPGQRGANSPNWKFVHRTVWEEAHGPIPVGHRIWWKDGDHTNCALANLELLSDAEHMARTTIHNLPPEVKKAHQAVGALRRQITWVRKKGERSGQEQAAGLA